MERCDKQELERKEKASGQDTRVDIHVISYRTRKHDPDGVSVKYVLDGIVASGILPDDSSQEIRKVTFESIVGKEEKTVIEIKEIKEHYKQEIKRMDGLSLGTTILELNRPIK